jgi:hypothetical protein
MFTDTDREFLARLDARASATLAAADPSQTRLRAALDAVRSILDVPPGRTAPGPLARVDELLDSVWRATTAHDPDRAKTEASRLSHAVRDLGVPGPAGMRAVSAVLEIRSLVVLAA